MYTQLIHLRREQSDKIVEQTQDDKKGQMWQAGCLNLKLKILSNKPYLSSDICVNMYRQRGLLSTSEHMEI